MTYTVIFYTLVGPSLQPEERDSDIHYFHDRSEAMHLYSKHRKITEILNQLDSFSGSYRIGWFYADPTSEPDEKFGRIYYRDGKLFVEFENQDDAVMFKLMI